MLDRDAERTPDFKPMTWDSATPSAILNRIDQAGIVGMGGAGYPTAAKLAAGQHYGTRQVVGNGVECEPHVSADRTLLQNYLEDVLEGLRIVGHCLECEQLMLAVADDDIRTRFERLNIDDVKCVRVDGSPASGEERTLLQTLFNARIPTTSYPTQFGYIVLNVATLFAICEAVRDGLRPQDRIVTVFDEDRWISIDTPLHQLTDASSPLRSGSMAIGLKAEASEVVSHTTNAIAYDQSDNARACIHCGWCDTVCPRDLPVEGILRRLQSESSRITNSDLTDMCFECGACVVVCPSDIPLLDWIRHGKRTARTDRLKQRGHARFERRNQRIALRQAEDDTARNVRLDTPRKW